MRTFLFIDLDSVYNALRQSFYINLDELALDLRSRAMFATGCTPDDFTGVTFYTPTLYDDYTLNQIKRAFPVQNNFELIGASPDRDMAEIASSHYLHYDTGSIGDVIIVTADRDLLSLYDYRDEAPRARWRIWGTTELAQDIEENSYTTHDADQVAFQLLTEILTLNNAHVWVYIDFENVILSLQQSGYIIDLNTLIRSFKRQALRYGSKLSMYAYAPWDRMNLPVLLDQNGNPIERMQETLLLENIDPVYSLYGKNAADMRMVRDLMGYAVSIKSSMTPNVFIIVSGDGDFITSVQKLIEENHAVYIWSVKGSLSSKLMGIPGIEVEYIDNFAPLRKVNEESSGTRGETGYGFLPSLESSLVLIYDQIVARRQKKSVPVRDLINELATYSERMATNGNNQIDAWIERGVLIADEANGNVRINDENEQVQNIRLIRDIIYNRVANTLEMRGWEYVNYGFLLNGLKMETVLENIDPAVDDSWRSSWVTTLVTHGILERHVISHQSNPNDTVPVISLAQASPQVVAVDESDADGSSNWLRLSYDELKRSQPFVANMCARIIVSIDQFTSYRNYDWCPLGSLHSRLRELEPGISFQRAVEYLEADEAVFISEYENPNSHYHTKGISLNSKAELVQDIITLRNRFIAALVHLYDEVRPITVATIREALDDNSISITFWINVMLSENVLNQVSGRDDQYSLFRGHHTVMEVAETQTT